MVLQVGGFGVWPDPSRVDKATRRHDGAGDFPAWLTDKRRTPRPTLFIKGNHEDFVWLDSRPDLEVLPGLNYVRNGCTVDIRDQGAGVTRVGGVGGCYGPSDYQRRSDNLQGYAKRHYTLDEVERLGNSGDVDILLTHDAPAGVRFERHRRRKGYISEAAGLDVLLARVQPRVCLVIITLESTPKLQVCGALGSTKSECREIWWPSTLRRSREGGTGHCWGNIVGG